MRSKEGAGRKDKQCQQERERRSRVWSPATLPIQQPEW